MAMTPPQSETWRPCSRLGSLREIKKASRKKSKGSIYLCPFITLNSQLSTLNFQFSTPNLRIPALTTHNS